MKKLARIIAAVLLVICCFELYAQNAKVFKVWPEASKLADDTWRPVVAVFIQQGNTEFMGTSDSLMSDRGFDRIRDQIILLQVDLAKKGGSESLSVVDDKNSAAMSALLGQAKTLPIFVVAGPDQKVLKLWEKADVATVKKEIVDVLKDALKKYKPLSDEDLGTAQKLLEKAEELEEEGKEKEAIKTLREITRMNKDCSFGRQAMETIERIESEDDEVARGFGEENEEVEQEDKEEEEKSPEPAKTASVLVKTDFGVIEIELLTEKTPDTCQHFMDMVKSGIYKNSTFGYVERNKLVQCTIDPSKNAPEEAEADFSDLKHEAGMVAMAHGSDSRKIGTDFYIVLGEYRERDGRYAIFGKVRKGMAVVKAIASSKTLNHRPVNKIGISEIEIVK